MDKGEEGCPGPTRGARTLTVTLILLLLLSLTVRVCVYSARPGRGIETTGHHTGRRDVREAAGRVNGANVQGGDQRRTSSSRWITVAVDR